MNALQEKALRELVADDSFADEVVRRVDALNVIAASDPAAIHKGTILAPPAPVVAQPLVAPPATAVTLATVVAPVPQPAVQAVAPQIVQPQPLQPVAVAPPPTVTNVANVAPALASATPLPATPKIDLMSVLRGAGLAPGHIPTTPQVAQPMAPAIAPVPIAVAPVIQHVAQPGTMYRVPPTAPIAPPILKAAQVVNPVQQLDALATQFKSTHPQVSAQLTQMVGALSPVPSNGAGINPSAKAILDALTGVRNGLETVAAQVKGLQEAEAPMATVVIQPPGEPVVVPVAPVQKGMGIEFPKAVVGMANRMMGR